MAAILSLYSGLHPYRNRLQDGRELTSREGIRGMRAWQWFMLIEGALSIAIAIAAGFVLPNWGEFDTLDHRETYQQSG